MQALILASASPRRREILKKARIAHIVCPVRVREIAPDYPHGMTPAEFVWRNALRKARAAAAIYPRHSILAADTAVALGTRIFGKPRNLKQAAEFLRALSGRTHEVLTAVILLTPRTWRPIGFVELSKVTFRKLSTQTINDYLKAVPVLDKAGAYALQEKGSWIVEKVSGSKSNVVGLPIERLSKLLKSHAVLR
jgi:septum formation protein